MHSRWDAMVEPLIEYGTKTCPLWKEVLELQPDTDLKKLTTGIIHVAINTDTKGGTIHTINEIINEHKVQSLFALIDLVGALF